MTIQYTPTSSVTVNHEIHTDLRFNAVIDDPVIKTDRLCTFTLSDTRYVSDTVNSWRGAGTLSENCVMSGSTLLYVDTVRGVYIWKYEEQGIVAEADGFIVPWRSLWVSGANSLEPGGSQYPCIGRSPFIKGVGGGEYSFYASDLAIKFTVPSWTVSCKETIFAITPKSAFKQTLVAEHTYTKAAFPGRTAGEVITPFAEMREQGGPDFYYPEWCRAMLNDFVWAQAAGERLRNAGHPEWYSSNPTNGTKDYAPPRNYLTDPTQIGALAFDTKDNFISSLVFNLHNPDNSVHRHIVNDSSIGDVLALIKSSATTYYPLGLI